jgi:hypothetical protein
MVACGLALFSVVNSHKAPGTLPGTTHLILTQNGQMEGAQNTGLELAEQRVIDPAMTSGNLERESITCTHTAKCTCPSPGWGDKEGPGHPPGTLPGRGAGRRAGCGL